MEKPDVFVPSDIGKTISVENGIGISDNRFTHLGFIMNDIIERHTRKDEALLAIASNPDLTTIEKTYMGYKLYERICRKKIPFWNQLSRGL